MRKKCPDNYSTEWALGHIPERRELRQSIELPRNETEAHLLLRKAAALEGHTGVPKEGYRVVNERPAQRVRNNKTRAAAGKRVVATQGGRNVLNRDLPKITAPDGSQRLDLDKLCEGLSLEPVATDPAKVTAVERTRDGTRVVQEEAVTVNWRPAKTPAPGKKRRRVQPFMAPRP